VLILMGLAPAMLRADNGEGAISKKMEGLRALPDAQRPAATIALAKSIQALPAGSPKLKLAYSLSHLVTEGDQGQEALQAVGGALAMSLGETPQPAAKSGAPAAPYMSLATLERYKGVKVELNDPMLAKALEILVANDAEIEKADFTLKDIHGKKVTLSELRGKIVLVNFWATWCPPCRKEMPALDNIYTHLEPLGLVVLSITDEDLFKVGSFVNQSGGYHPPVLLDPGRKVATQFHVDGIPKSFVFDREGKLVGQSIDEMTQKQFLMMLADAGLHP
jgi:peroxiredoxin